MVFISKKTKRNSPKICLVCSAGGHLSEMVQLEGCYSKYDHFFITFRRPDTEELARKEKVHFIDDPGRSPIKFIKSLISGLRILLKERPDTIISTGAGVAIGPCYMGKLLGSKIIFLESFCRIEVPSISGKLAYPIADLFFVQWKEMLEKYGDKAIYRGSVA